jgi:hypothetical protein
MEIQNKIPDIISPEKGYFFRIGPIILFLSITIFEVAYLNYQLHISDAMQYIAVAIYIIHALSGGLVLLAASGIKSLLRNQQKGWVIAYWFFLGQTVISGLALSLWGFIIYLFIGGYTEIAFQKTHGGVKLRDVAMKKEAKKKEE